MQRSEFSFNSITRATLDDNECESGNAECSVGTYCENTPGKYVCKGSEPALDILHSLSLSFSLSLSLSLIQRVM